MNYQNAQKLAAALVTVLAINDPSITAALEGYGLRLGLLECH